jgi:FtsZ-binding cell division protein ZapB
MTSRNFEQLEEDWPRFRKDIANLKVQIRELKEAENEVRQDIGDLVPPVNNV